MDLDLAVGTKHLDETLRASRLESLGNFPALNLELLEALDDLGSPRGVNRSEDFVASNRRLDGQLS